MEKPIVLVLAGGSGTRLWPLSRKDKPKQLLSLYSPKTLVEETYKRAKLLTSPQNIYIGTNPKLAGEIAKYLPLPKENYILEPQAKNTAPIIAYFMALMEKEHKKSQKSCVVLSADHYIGEVDLWAKTLRQAFAQKEYLVCLGIKPKRIETGYGYMEVGGEISGFEPLRKIISFREKPNEILARQYLEKGNYYWNSGIFVFPVNVFQKELEKNALEIYSLAQKATKNHKEKVQAFKKMPDISIDYALLEKSKSLACLISDITWDDVGSFEAFARILPKDETGNYIAKAKEIQSLKAKENIIYAPNKKIALLGVENLVVVEGDGILLIAKREDLGDIKKIRELFPKDL